MEFKKAFISELKPAAYNPRKDLQPGDPEYERIKSSIEAFGYVEPVIINTDHTVISGHQRLKVLRELGHTSIDVVVVDIEDKNREKALNVALNKITGEWDMEKLSMVMNDIQDSGALDVTLTGFTDIELHDIFSGTFGEEKKVVEDDYTPPPEIETDIVRGDIIQLGRHRVMCGDSTCREDVERLMDGKKADMMVTDPPYGVSYAAKNEFLNAVGRGNLIQTPIENDDKTPENMKLFWDAAFQTIRPFMGPGSPYYTTGPQGGDLLLLLLSLKESGFPLRHMLVWAKNNHVLGRSDYNYKHEPIIYGWIEGSHKFYGSTGETSLWEIDKPHESKLHPTMKPVALFSRAIGNSSLNNQIIIDPFLGSGTTLIACEQLDRICYGMEISPQYCEIISQRWEKLTGEKRGKVEL